MKQNHSRGSPMAWDFLMAQRPIEMVSNPDTLWSATVRGPLIEMAMLLQGTIERWS